MKRAMVVAVLLLFIAGVVFLFLFFEDGYEQRNRRDAEGHAAAPRSTAVGTDGGDALHGATADARGRDDDPNRIDGPRLWIRGQVVANDEPVVNAQVEILRAPPTTYSSSYHWQRTLDPAYNPVIADTRTADDGRFDIDIARRSVLVVRARAPGHAPATIRILAPTTGDLEDVVLRLGEAGTMSGIVVNESDEPVANAAVTLHDNDRTRAPLYCQTKTAEDGTFSFADLAKRGYRLTVRADGYGSAWRWTGVDEGVRVVLGPACVIEGRITLADGTPVQAAAVEFQNGHLVDARKSGRGEATTDADGRYRIADMPPGYVTSIRIETEGIGILTTGNGALQLRVAATAPDKPLVYDIELAAATAVMGRVLVADGGGPAAGAHVALLRLAPQQYSLSDVAHTVADAQGRFSFPYVSEGGYAIEAKATGAARIVRRWMDAQRGVSTDFYADGRTAPPEQVIELVKTGAVDGRVLNLEKTSGFGVHLMTDDGQINGVADDLMNFRFAHVPAMAEAQVSAWNPSLKSEPFEVVAGETAKVVLDGGTGRAFTGVVRDESGRPVAGAYVMAMPEQNMQWQLRQFMQQNAWGSARTGADGRFRYALPEWMSKTPHKQKWIVLARADGYALGEAGGVKVPKDGAPPDVELTLREGGVVSGNVEMLGGGPIVDARVTVSPRKRKGEPIEKRRTLSATTKADGTFEIRGVEEGTYRLSVYHRDAKGEGRDVTAGSTGLRIEMKPTAAIRGVVIDENGLPLSQTRARIYAVVPTAKGERKQYGGILTGGRFQILNLEPGTYAVEVEPNPSGGGAGQPGFVKKRTDGIATGATDVTIRVEPGPRIRGRVFGPDGGAVAGVTVIAMPLKPKKSRTRASPSGNAWSYAGRGGGASNITNSRGEFEIRGVADEQVELVAIKRGFPVAAATAAAGDTGVAIRLSAGATIEAIVLQPDGRPLKQAWFNIQPMSPEFQQKLRSWQQRGGQAWNRVGGWQLTQGRTGADGRFAMAGLEPGKYRLWLNTTDGVLTDNVIETGRGRVTLQLQTPFKIAGVVTGADGKPIVLPPGQMGYVSASQGSRQIVGAQINRDGSFEIAGVPGGEIKLNVWAPGHVHKTLTVEAGATGVEITLDPVKKKPPR